MSEPIELSQDERRKFAAWLKRKADCLRIGSTRSSWWDRSAMIREAYLYECLSGELENSANAEQHNKRAMAAIERAAT